MKSKSYSYRIEVPVSSKPLKGTRYHQTIRNVTNGLERNIYEKVVAKDVKNNIRLNNITFNHYRKLQKKLQKGKIKRITVRQAHLKSKNHEIKTISVKKVPLSANDTKRYLLNEIETLPFGHCDAGNSSDTL